MVYCPECGTKNEEAAKYCANCGMSLEISKEKRLETRTKGWEEEFEKRAERWGEEFGRRAERWGEELGKRGEEECFGLPNFGAIVGLIFGIMIVVFGVVWIAGFSWEVIGPSLLVIFGILIVVGTVYGLAYRR